MNTNWYIARDRKKQGPFSLAQMLKMVGDGQLLPIDMVLQEGTTQWMAASQVVAFFPGSGTAPPPPIPIVEATEWYFSQAGSQSGPVTMAHLKGLADAGTLHPADLVWKTGMAAWVAASSIQGLFPAKGSAPAPARRPQHGLGDQGEEPRPCRNASDRAGSLYDERRHEPCHLQGYRQIQPDDGRLQASL